ncbi:ABC transporter permease subunit [Synechococcales cyanobacterium C]|uniref:ABC transporter permease subunit n=1 Tax=Petrachloros mirabilis ULC683 TaxID=2781853 RepID=A0A8K1ZW33_9CYAN|nr:ABC transporter permease subunit [Petrachloros mirabilis]NCJ04952.1 ABC transporter permease subunit [Petrachloros mirabilis ULC683]
MKIILRSIIAIYRKELQGYFSSSLAYVIAGVFWFLSSLFFFFILDNIVREVAQLDLQGQFGVSPPPVDVPSVVLQNFMAVMGSLSLVILPILSMGLYAEERKRGTLELLATSPITNWAVALGKLLAVLTFFVTLIMPLAVIEGLALSRGQPPIPLVTLLSLLMVSHLGLVFMAAAILALGLFISSLTDSSILAAIVTFALILLLWIVDLLGDTLGGGLGEMLNHLSLLKHYTTLTQGVLDLSSFVLFLSYVVLGLFLTAQSIDLFRFQRS